MRSDTNNKAIHNTWQPKKYLIFYQKKIYYCFNIIPVFWLDTTHVAAVFHVYSEKDGKYKLR